MICFLCLDECSDIFEIYSIKGKSFQVADIITKHFGLKLKPSINSEDHESLCFICWEKLEAFHSFYIAVQKAHEHTNSLTTYNINDAKEEYCEKSNNSMGKVFVEDDYSVDINALHANNNDDRIPKSSSFLDFNSKHDSEDDNRDSDKTNPKVRIKSKEKRSRKDTPLYQKSIEYDAIISQHMQLTCSICKLPLDNFDELKKHFRSAHKIDGYAVCCKKQFVKRAYLVDHIKVHLNPESFKCMECGKLFAHRRSLKGHVETHKYTNQTMFSCDKCEKSFFSLKLLKRHKPIHIPEEERQYKCDVCIKLFSTHISLNVHRRVVHENVDDLICDICGHVVRGISALRVHHHRNHRKPSISVDSVEEIHNVEISV